MLNPVISIGIQAIRNFAWAGKISPQIQVGNADLPHWPTENCLVWKRLYWHYWQWTLFACEIWVIWLYLNEEMIWITDLSTLDELLCGGLLVVLGPAPGVQGRGLQGTSIREGEGPGFVQRAGVDGVQVDGRLLLTLTSREESHTCQENGTVISPHNV